MKQVYSENRFHCGWLIGLSVVAWVVLSGSLVSAAILYVDDDDPTCGSLSPCYSTIPAAIAAAGNGDTIMVRPGIYSDPLNIEGFSGLTIEGAGAGSVVFRPATTLPFNVGGYGSARQCAIRVVNSTGADLSGMTMDFDLIKGNNKFGILYWDSTGSVSDNVLENMSASDAAGFYGEITSYFRAPTFTPTARASATITGNTFINCGRLGILAHDYVDMLIEDNLFYKTLDDFGYAMELGSASVAVVRSNEMYGFDTPALSDGSASGGIYIENCYTNTVVDPIVKTMTLEDNEIYGNQQGLIVGNQLNGYAGNVDIVLEAFNNRIHDNIEGGVILVDEDASAGSSLTAHCHHNAILSNGTTNSYGYFIYSYGDGNITATFDNELIAGHTVGFEVYETASVASIYSVSIHHCSIENTDGLDASIAGLTIDASCNWWNANTPVDVAGMISGTGPVDYTPWIHVGTDTDIAPGFQPDLSYLHADDTSVQTGSSPRITEAIGRVVTGGTVQVEAGTYTEDILIDRALTLQGVGSSSTILVPSGIQTDFYFLSMTHVLVGADDVTIQALQLAGNESICDEGIMIEDFDGTAPLVVTSVQVLDCDIHHYNSDAVYCIGGYDIMTGITITNNTIHGIRSANLPIGWNPTGITLENAAGTVSDNTLSESFVTYGICSFIDSGYSNLPAPPRILNNAITNLYEPIVSGTSRDNRAIIAMSPAAIEENVITNTNYGIQVQLVSAVGGPFDGDVTVHANEIYDLRPGPEYGNSAALYLNTIQGQPSRVVTVSDNIVDGVNGDSNDARALVTWVTSAGTISWLNNTITGYGEGLNFRQNLAATLIDGNSFSLSAIENDPTETEIGIWLREGSIGTFSNNTIDGYDTNFYLPGTSDGVIISCNDILNATEYGIHLTPETGFPNLNVSVRFNNIIGNQAAGLQVETSAHTGSVFAEDNWWGDEDGPAGNGPGDTGDAVFGDVDYSPWFLTEIGDPCPPAATPTPDPTETPANTPTPTPSTPPGTPTPTPTPLPVPTNGPIGIGFLLLTLSFLLGGGLIFRKG